MREFGYERVVDVSGAVALLGADPDARFLGGGTNLVDLMKAGVETARAAHRRARTPPRPDRGHARTAGCASARPSPTAISPPTPTSGAATRRWRRPCWPAPRASCATWPRSAGICSSAPAAATSPTSAKPCNKRVPGSGCPALTGEHHNHAILGASEHCVATHPSDMGVALAAFDAVVSYETADGPGELPICRVLSAGGRHPAPRDRPAARRADHRRHPAAGPGRRPLALPEGARARLVRVRDRLDRRRARRPGRCRTRSAPRLRGGRVPAVAGPRRPSGC